MAESFQRARKLTQEDVRAIVNAVRAGTSQNELARRYGVSIGAINYRLSKHLERPIDQKHCPTCTCLMRGT